MHVGLAVTILPVRTNAVLAPVLFYMHTSVTIRYHIYSLHCVV